jgi:hypothetical protein
VIVPMAVRPVFRAPSTSSLTVSAPVGVIIFLAETSNGDKMGGSSGGSTRTARLLLSTVEGRKSLIQDGGRETETPCFYQNRLDRLSNALLISWE